MHTRVNNTIGALMVTLTLGSFLAGAWHMDIHNPILHCSGHGLPGLLQCTERQTNTYQTGSSSRKPFWWLLGFIL